MRRLIGANIESPVRQKRVIQPPMNPLESAGGRLGIGIAESLVKFFTSPKIELFTDIGADRTLGLLPRDVGHVSLDIVEPDSREKLEGTGLELIRQSNPSGNHINREKHAGVVEVLRHLGTGAGNAGVNQVRRLREDLELPHQIQQFSGA